MATPCFIVQVLEDGRTRAVTCRSDGYISGVGAYLIRFYQDEAKIGRLMEKMVFSPIEAEVEDLELYVEPGEDQRDPSYPDIVSAIEALELAGDMAFIWEKGGWTVAALDIDPETNRFVLGERTPLTRELILGEDPTMGPWLDETKPPLTLAQALDDFREKSGSEGG
jgi:hypothetical protein